MSEREAMQELVIKANVEAICGLRKSHGDRVALIMTRGLLSASSFMLKMMVGPHAAAAELWTIADQYAGEDVKVRWPNK
jgi:hypothetical protein